MDAETQAHLFEPFFTSKALGQGTGLGLATVYGIVKQNNGIIVVRSAPGRGTVFQIYLPRVAQGNGAAMDGAVAPAVKPKTAAGTETILIVEDEEAILNIARRFLSRLGYQVLTATSPAEAMEVAKHHPAPIHLLLTDVVMPGMSGRELRDQLSLIRPGMPCLFMSGYATQVIAPLGVLETAGDIIHKPFTANLLAGKVREALDHAGARFPVPVPPAAAV